MSYDYSQNRVHISNHPIESVRIQNSSVGQRQAEKMIPDLNPGDILSLSDTTHRSYFRDGLYIVSEKDKVNKGVTLTGLNEFGVKKNNTLATADSVDGEMRLLGHLDIKA